MFRNSGRRRLSGLAFFVILAAVEIPSVDCGPPPWLNICMPNGKQYYIPDVPACPSGYLFKTPISGFCVCGHGVWQLKTDYCGKDIIVVPDDGDCYSITTPIRWIRHIGNKYDGFAEYYFVTDPGWDEIRPIKSSTLSPGGYSIVGAIGPRHVLLSCNEDHCVQVAKKPEEGVYHIWDHFPPVVFSNISKTDGYSRRRDCPMDILVDPIPYESAIVKHGMLNRMGGKAVNYNASFTSWPCKQSCTVEPPIPYYNDTWDETDPAMTPNCTETENNYKELPGIMMNQTREQSVRLMKNHYDVILKGKKTPTVNITEYEYFQTARILFSKLCPESEVPAELLIDLLRMFRVVVNESQEKYPYRQLGDKSEDARIKAGLAQCMAKVNQPIQFVYNETVCPHQFLQTKFSYYGAVRNFSSVMPCDLQYNTTKYDYVSELAWKMVMFVHYFCAVDFENAGFDHSRLEYKLRNLFNREIRHRWYKQGESAQLIEHLFQRFDLNRFKIGVDRCVAAARDASPYRKWIWRPKYVQYCGKGGARSSPEGRSRNPEIIPPTELWGGDAHCLHSFNEAFLSGWARSASTCLTTPVDPDCRTWDERDPPPCLILPSPTFENPKGQELEKRRLIKCYEKVGDWMFEPGGEELCHIYKYGDNLKIGENYTQFDGKHCWSEYYEVTYLCDECREGLENVLEKIHDEPENGTKHIIIPVPQGKCNLSSKGHSIQNKELRQCWEILGDLIFEPGNELICYYINFGLGMKPLQPPPYHIPQPTFKDPRGQALTDVDQKRCYKNLGDWMFVPGNELLCCYTNDGQNVKFTTVTQTDEEGGKNCFSFEYQFLNKCEYEENLTSIGFPDLKKNETRECETTDVVPVKSPNSKGHQLKDPDLIQCWNILGDVIFQDSHKYDCYYICFGKDLIPNTTPEPPHWSSSKWCNSGACNSNNPNAPECGETTDSANCNGGTRELFIEFRVQVGKSYKMTLLANKDERLVVDLAYHCGETACDTAVPATKLVNLDIISHSYHFRINQRWRTVPSKDTGAFLIQSHIPVDPPSRHFVAEYDHGRDGTIRNRDLTDGATQQWILGRQYDHFVEIKSKAYNLCWTNMGFFKGFKLTPCGISCDVNQLFKFEQIQGLER